MQQCLRRQDASDGTPWLTDHQLDDLRSQQLLRPPNRTLLEANEVVQALLFKAQVDRNETTGERDPVVRLIDFHLPANNQFHAINQFHIDTPGCERAFILPDIVLFVNGIALAVVECKKGSETCANPMQEAFVQLQRTATIRRFSGTRSTRPCRNTESARNGCAYTARA